MCMVFTNYGLADVKSEVAATNYDLADVKSEVAATNYDLAGVKSEVAATGESEVSFPTDAFNQYILPDKPLAADIPASYIQQLHSR